MSFPMPHNQIMRAFILSLAACAAVAAQAPRPVPIFSSESIRVVGRNSKLLAPGMVLELYGQHLSPEPWCGQERIPKAPLPLELCGVRVLINSTPAELMFVGPGQINFKIPAGVPAEGAAPFRVCVAETCSAPVSMRFAARTAVLTLERPASVRMPVWIDVDAPPPYAIAYLCDGWPWSFPGYEFEVRRNGKPLAPLPQPAPPPGRPTAPNGSCLSGSPRGRLPLHLLYRFDQPGAYSVRFTAKKGADLLYQSDWTDIEIEPFSEQKREAWLRSLEANVNQRNAGDVVPSLLAWPDEKALAVLLKVIPPDASACVNYDCERLALGRAALAGFDDTLLRGLVPSDRLLRLCPPSGNCK